MNSYTPAQQEAITNLSGNMVVCAGAGSGKTRVLVERYIHILRQGEAGC
jgi:ATP-dependent helicase/nuclease subunit A